LFIYYMKKYEQGWGAKTQKSLGKLARLLDR